MEEEHHPIEPQITQPIEPQIPQILTRSHRICFLDSHQSEEFCLFLSTLERSYLVGLDAEWKPVSSRRPGAAYPRVSILQIACRLREDSSGIAGVGGRDELVFVLDLLSLPAWAFWKAMKTMLVSPTVLKLGFKFKQDLVNLAASFPGPDAHSCFAKVEPYVDIGKLYRELGCGISCLDDVGMAWESLSLASISEDVLGIHLCKDLQCSDWELRPLSPKQVAYAATDAYCLLVIYDTLVNKVFDEFHRGLEMPDIPECCQSARVGVAELLPIIHELTESHASSSILRSKHGVAVSMIKSVLEGKIIVTSKFPTVNKLPNTDLTIAERFGEKIYGSRDGGCRAVKKKPKTRRGRNTGRCKAEQEVIGWCGPPPWDPSLGGDGVPKFLCDVMVGGLAKQLRNVGIDTASPHVHKIDPRTLVEQTEREGRVLLTRDIKLLRCRFVPRNFAYRVRSLAKQDQLTEVLQAFNLTIAEDQLLSRCTKCNGEFIPEPLTPEEAIAAVPERQELPDYALRERLIFWQCSVCQHIYWQGNQFHRAMKTFQALARKLQVQTMSQ